MSQAYEKNIPYLDGWRGLSIIAVLIGHFGPEKYAWCGRMGVVLFFVLSGLFMGRILFLRQVSLPAFFVRRFSRIFPTLWLYLFCMYFYAKYGQPQTYTLRLDEILSSLLFLGTYFPSDISIWGSQWANGHLWSLNVEEHSYLYLAAGLVLIAKSRGRITKNIFLWGSVCLVLFITVLYMSGILADGTSPWRIHSEVASLGLLTSAAYGATRDKTVDSFWNKSWTVAVFFALIGLMFFRPRFPSFWNISILLSPILLAIAVNHLDSAPAFIKKLMSLPLLRWFGRCSFSIYLWQDPFYALTAYPGYPKYLCLLGGIILGAISYYCVENPARRYLNARWAAYEQRLRMGQTLQAPPINQ